MRGDGPSDKQLPAVARVGTRAWAAQYLPLPALLAVCGIYFLFVFLPASNSATLVRQALAAARHYTSNGAREPDRFLSREVVTPLREAHEADRGNAHTLVLLATWQGELWKVSTVPDGRDGVRALDAAREARRLNPEGWEPYQVAYLLHTTFARGTAELARIFRERAKKPNTPEVQKKADEDEARRRDALAAGHHADAAAVLEAYLPRDPTDPRLRFRLAASRKSAGLSDWEEPAREALRLDERSVGSVRKLSAPERVQLRQWLQGPPG